MQMKMKALPRIRLSTANKSPRKNVGWTSRQVIVNEQ